MSAVPPGSGQVWPPRRGVVPGRTSSGPVEGAGKGRPWFARPPDGAGHGPAAIPETGRFDAVFQATVRDIVQTVVDQIDPDAGRGRARMLIEAEVRRRIEDGLMPGGAPPTVEMQNRLAAAVFDELFGLGPLQPLLNDPAVENIDVNGCDQVWVEYASGERVRGPAVAASDAELVEKIQLWSRQGNTAREFSVASPLLNTALQDLNGARLTASMSVSPRPYVSIRCHRLKSVTLDDLVERGSLDEGLRAFLTAAVLARRNIIVTGGTSAGKTTLLRALVACIPSDQRIATLETDFELFLHELPDRHSNVIAFESRQPNSEGAGGVSLHDLIPQALRHNPRRIIVGEVRSTEILPMLEAMQSGHEGSMCTIHANGAEDAFNRMLLLALRGGIAMPVNAVHLMVGMSVDFVVHLRRDGTNNQRYVSEVLEVLPPGDTERPSVNHVYVPDARGRATPRTTPHCLDLLVAAGFDPSWLNRGGHWGASNGGPA
ncbi:CpaF family protein [Actinomadura chibensis]|uniref:CpaF family protein n=1 Tax=Actinomadura chibensis TaxID=392828 RepID=UPI00082B7E22|nr:ATPase, T2SS/T4P/T4SS family [Actinomadura chibensis]